MKRELYKIAIAYLIAMALITCAVSAQPTNKTEAISKGADWLIAHQSANGGWQPYSTSYNNALAIRAYVATNNTSSTKYALLLNKLKQ
ncbi:MAG: hypothetical protein ACE5J9_03760, partial [Methanosarcinales archaeon]